MVKGLYQRNWSKDQIVLLFVLIDEMMGLPDDWEKAFDADLTAFEEEQHVRYVSSIERLGYQRGVEEGIEKGIEKGREEGLLEGIALVLDARFGASGLKLLPKVNALGELAQLRKFSRFLKTAKTLKEVRDYFG